MNTNLCHALDAMNELSYKPLNTVDYVEGEYFLPTTWPSPEELFSKKECFDNLPKECKYILDLIYSIPTELVEELTHGSGNARRGKFVSYLRSHFNWKPLQIEGYLKKLRGLI